MKIKFFILLFIFQSCSKSKSNIPPVKSCLLESFNNVDSKISGNYVYDSKKQLVSFNSNIKDANFTTAYSTIGNSGNAELHDLGTFSFEINEKKQITYATSTYGNFTLKYNNDNITDILFESSRASTTFGPNQKWNYKFEGENGNIKKVYLTLGTAIQNRLVFEGLAFDDKINKLPLVSRYIQLFRTLINLTKGGDTLDFYYLCHNNIITKTFYQIGKPLIKLEYTYSYDTEGNPINMEYQSNGIKYKITYKYICE